MCVYYTITNDKKISCVFSPRKMERLFMSIDTILTNRFIRDIEKDKVSIFVVYHNEMFALFLIEVFSQYLLRLTNRIGRV